MNRRATVIEAHERLGGQERECFGVLLGLARALEGCWDHLCLIGGWAVYLLTESFTPRHARAPLRHRGSMDMDIAVVSTEAALEDVAALARGLAAAGYHSFESYRWVRELPSGRRYAVDAMAVPPPGHEGGPIHIGQCDLAPFWRGASALTHTHLLSHARPPPRWAPRARSSAGRQRRWPAGCEGLHRLHEGPTTAVQAHV